MKQLGKLLAMLSIMCLSPNADTQTNSLPPFSAPAPLLDDGQTWEDWTNGITYKAITVRKGVTNVVLRNTADRADYPAPVFTNATVVISGQLTKVERENAYFTVSARDTLTGETNMVIRFKSNKPTGFIQMRITQDD